jgi:thiol-disulfide isomerase/thioredoxin
MQEVLLRSLAVTLALAAGASAQAGGESLGVGMRAPALEHVTWIQGDTVAAWEPGQVYVLDFWATWCPPCRKSIPHINALAQKYRDQGVHVIGVAVAPRPGMQPTKAFVTEQGEGMTYGIAEDIEGQTSATFMEAASCFGIPTVMVVDRKGELAFIGSPFGMDDTLAKIVAGTDDRAAAIAADAARRAPYDGARKLAAALAHYDTLDAAAATELLVTCDEALAREPDSPQLAYTKYRLLTKAGPKETASAYGREIVAGPLAKLPKALHLLAWGIVDPKSNASAAERDLDTALAAAARADELTEHKDASILDTLARVHFWKGDLDQAIALQKEALARAESDEQKAEIQATLAEYEQAKAGG